MAKSKLSSLILFVLVLTLLSLHGALNFHFWRDDWVDYLIVQSKTGLSWINWCAFRLHPGSAVEKFIGYHVFGLVPLYWQIFGLFLKVADSLAIGLMMWGLTRSKRAAIISCLLFASFVGGLESFVWVSAHTSALFILFLSIGIFFWVSSFREKGLKKQIIALILLGLSAAITPARATFLFLVLTVWEVLTYIRFQTKKNLLKISTRIGALWILYGFIFFVFERMGLPIFTAGGVDKYIQTSLIKQDALWNYFSNIGNLLIGWLIPIPEAGSLTNFSMISALFGILLLVALIISLINFFIKKTLDWQISVFFLFWTYIFYFPNWLFDMNLTVGISHRYLAISAVGVSCLFAFLFSKVKTNIPVLLFILLNIFSSNKIIGLQSTQRSVDVVESFWNKIEKDVPKNEKNDIFVYSGSDPLKGTILDWSGSVPFGIKRGIINFEEYPIVTADKDLIIKLLCIGEGIYRPSVNGWVYQKLRIQLSHLHTWDLSNGVLTNTSQNIRDLFQKEAKCKLLL